MRAESSPPLTLAIPAARPRRTTLSGRLVTLAPLDPTAHGEALYAGSHGAEKERLWRYLSDGPYPDFASFSAALARKAASEDPLFFTVLSNITGDAIGYASYLRIEPNHRVIEVGNILYLPSLQRTAAATESMYLMARHAIDDLGFRRYEWKCNARNEPSRRAALRLGFTYEGTFRQHMIVKGQSRDTAWFSMLDGEWSSRKAALERWLDPGNFDETGRQRSQLDRANLPPSS